MDSRALARRSAWIGDVPAFTSRSSSRAEAESRRNSAAFLLESSAVAVKDRLARGTWVFARPQAPKQMWPRIGPGPAPRASQKAFRAYGRRPPSLWADFVSLFHHRVGPTCRCDLPPAMRISA